MVCVSSRWKQSMQQTNFSRFQGLRVTMKLSFRAENLTRHNLSNPQTTF